MQIKLISLDVIFFYVVTECHDNFVGITLNLVENTVIKELSHSNNLYFCDSLLVNPVVILKSLNICLILEEVEIKHYHLATY
jgi:Mg2+/Co2+ transporter CorC